MIRPPVPAQRRISGLTTHTWDEPFPVERYN
jgi:hypothetical protein